MYHKNVATNRIQHKNPTAKSIIFCPRVEIKVGNAVGAVCFCLILFCKLTFRQLHFKSTLQNLHEMFAAAFCHSHFSTIRPCPLAPAQTATWLVIFCQIAEGIASGDGFLRLALF